MAITKTPRLDQTRWSSGQDVVKREDFDNDAAELEANAVLYKEGPLSARPAAGVGGRFYTVKNDPTPSNNRRQYYDNGVDWVALSYTANQVAESLTPGDTALTVQSANAPTADVFRVQNNSGVNLFAVNKDGYATNVQATGAGGVRLGNISSHDSTGYFTSVGDTKPVIVVRGTNNQTGNLLEFRAGNNSVLTQINSAGGLTTVGNIIAAGFTSSDVITAPRIVATNSANLFNTTITPASSDHVGLSVLSGVSQSANLVEMYNPIGTRVSRFLSDGTFATNGRIMIGDQGNSGTQSYPASTASLTVRNAIGATTPALNLYAGATGQTARMMQLFDTSGNMRMWADSAGNLTVTNNLASDTLALGNGSSTSPTTLYSAYTPKFEVVTGTGTTSYSESVVLRHTGRNSSALNRRVGIQMNLSDESNATESNKWAGISAFSTAANAANVGLSLYTSGTEAGRFESDNTFRMYGDARFGTAGKGLHFATGSADKIFMSGDNSYGTLGMQSANTAYVRADQFAIYSGGNFNQNALNSGGGTTLATFTTDRTILSRLTLTSPNFHASTQPAFAIGDDNDSAHMQFSNYSINVYNDASNTVSPGLYLQNDGGNLGLGSYNSTVAIASRVLYMGGNKNAVVFAPSSMYAFGDLVSRSPNNGDIWFDHTRNQIGFHNGASWKWIG